MKQFKGTISILLTCIAVQVACLAYPPIIDFLSLSIDHGPLWWIGLITSQFTHGGWDHLFGNFTFCLPFMLYLEHRLGSRRFVEFFLICGIASGLLQLWMLPSSNCVGASGSLFGVMAGACCEFGESHHEHWLAMGLFLVMFLHQIAVAPFGALFGIAVYGHIGGGLAGLILAHRHYKKVVCPTLTRPPALPAKKSSRKSTRT